MSDVSAFSTVLDAIWAALEDTGTSQGAALLAWRQDQTAGAGGGGKNYSEGWVPTPGEEDDEIPDDDLPALLIGDDALASVEDELPGGVDVLRWPVQIIGFVRESEDSYGTQAKARKLAELVYSVILFGKRTCFGVDNLILRAVRITGLSFGAESTDSGLRGSFNLELLLDVQLTI